MSTAIKETVETQPRESAEKKLPPWKVVFTVIRQKPGFWIVNFTSLIFLNAGFMIPGFLQKLFFDYIDGSTPAGINPITISALFMGAALMTVCSRLGITLSNTPFFLHTETRLRKNIMANILKQPGAAALPDSPGEAVSRFLGDVTSIPLFGLWQNNFLTQGMMSLAALIIMLIINPWVTLAALVPILLVGIISSVTVGKIAEYHKAHRTSAGRVSGFIGELFGAVLSVKSACAEEPVIERFDTINDERRKAALKDRVFNEILHTLFLNSAALGTGVILLLVGNLIQHGSFSVGDFAMFNFNLGIISNFTAFSGMLVARYKQIGVSTDRIQRLMKGSRPDALIEPTPIYMKGNIPPLERSAINPEEQLKTLEVRSLGYNYPDRNRGISDISFTLNRGELTVITGRIGSGKTTLLRALIGLLPPGEGEVLWNHCQISDPSAFFIPPRAAYTPQVPRLFSDSLRENICLGRPFTEEEINEALRLAVMDEDLAGFEEGLETKVGPRGVRLSGGQIQRSAAARMFVQDPELLVFDDLSSALDVETENRLWERIFAEKDRRTCLAVSNRRAALNRADRIILLKDGRIEGIGTLAELMKSTPEMGKLLAEK